MRNARPSNPFRLAPVAHDRAMLVTFVQGIIGALNENFPPFDERRRQKSGDGAKNYLLEESGVHVDPSSTPGATIGYQKPHCCVRMIHSPSRKLVKACARTQVERLLLQYATAL